MACVPTTTHGIPMGAHTERGLAGVGFVSFVSYTFYRTFGSVVYLYNSQQRDLAFVPFS
jgi:hypothetical protein